MLLFALISVLNLALGFAAAVALGYGPRPWWGIFAEPGTLGTVHIEKLEDESEPLAAAASDELEQEDEEEEEDDLDDEDDSEPDDELEEEPEEDEEAIAKSKLARLQEINANKLAKRLEEEQRRSPTKELKSKAKPSPVTPELDPEPEAEAAEEADSFSVSNIIDDDDLSSMIDEAAFSDEAIAADEMDELISVTQAEVADDDIDESLDEIESLLKAAGQLEDNIAAELEAEKEPVAKAEEAPTAEVAEQDESDSTDHELTADEIEAMFKLQ